MRRGAWGAIIVGAIVVVVWLSMRSKAPPSDGSSTTTSAPADAPTVTSGGGASGASNASKGSSASSGITVAPSASTKPNDVFARAKWGTGRDELGRSRQAEGNAEAPMSVVVDGDGNVVVLDQVNGRLVRRDRDGNVLGTLPIAQRAPQDVASAKDGSLVVLDRLGDKSISIVGADGSVKSLPLEGKGISEGGAVTGVFVDGKDVYVEREHQQLVRIGDTSGRADDARREIPGRPTRDGLSYLNAWIQPEGDSFFVTSTAREPQEHRFTRQVQVPFVVRGLLLLDSDRAGIVYVAVFGATPSASNPDGDPIVELVCLEPTHGAPIGAVTLPANTMPEETFRELAVLDEGGAIYLLRTEAGVTMMRADCRGGG